jgi:hypothetical protein
MEPICQCIVLIPRAQSLAARCTVVTPRQNLGKLVSHNARSKYKSNKSEDFDQQIKVNFEWKIQQFISYILSKFYGSNTTRLYHSRWGNIALNYKLDRELLVFLFVVVELKIYIVVVIICWQTNVLSLWRDIVLKGLRFCVYIDEIRHVFQWQIHAWQCSHFLE